MDAKFVFHPSSPPRRATFLRVPRLETRLKPWAKFSSPFGAQALRSGFSATTRLQPKLSFLRPCRAADMFARSELTAPPSPFLLPTSSPDKLAIDPRIPLEID